ncbi:MAG: hypothetical protein ABGZ36_25040, partial [Actinomycetota bacterium]
MNVDADVNGNGVADCADPCLVNTCANGGICQAFGRDLQNAHCGGAAPPPLNSCGLDGCADHEACGDGSVCIPPGVFGHVRSGCAGARCRIDADCDAHPGGECLPFFALCARYG